MDNKKTRLVYHPRFFVIVFSMKCGSIINVVVHRKIASQHLFLCNKKHGTSATMQSAHLIERRNTMPTKDITTFMLNLLRNFGNGVFVVVRILPYTLVSSIEFFYAAFCGAGW